MSILTKEFYLRDNVIQISKELLGKSIYTKIGDELTGGIITETEAYAGISDKASHAYKGRRTRRNEVMYSEGGVAYVYLCYGIHNLFNIVTNQKDVPDAILLRAIKPTEGLELMMKRRNKNSISKSFSNGPGSVSQALGITLNHNGYQLSKNIIWIEDDGILIDEKDIIITTRIGIDYAGEDRLLPYRFYINI